MGQNLDVSGLAFRNILFKQIKFSGLRALAWCFMGNHFHLNMFSLLPKKRTKEGVTRIILQ